MTVAADVLPQRASAAYAALLRAGANFESEVSIEVAEILQQTGFTIADLVYALGKLKLADALDYRFFGSQTVSVVLKRNDVRNVNVNVNNNIYNIPLRTYTNVNVTSAETLADRLREPRKVNFYRKLARLYPPEAIDRALNDCFKVKEENIRKSRAALFVYLLKIYGNKKQNGSGDCPR